MNGLEMVQAALAACAESLSGIQLLLASSEDKQSAQYLQLSQEISKCEQAVHAGQLLWSPGDSTADLHLLLDIADERVILTAALLIVKWYLTTPGELKDQLWECHELLEKSSDLIEAVKADLPDIPPPTKQLN